MATISVLQFICPTGFYGAERWILALNSNLDPRNIRSDLVVTKESDIQLELINQFQSGECQAFELIVKSRFSVSALRGLCKLIKLRNIDIIHTHGYKSDILGILAAKLTGIKAISTPHGFGESIDLKLRIYIYLGKVALRYFDVVAPLSQQLFEEVQRAKVPVSKISFIRNAVDLQEIDGYRLSKSKSTNSPKKIVGYVGQLIPRKRIDHILDIFNQLWLEDNEIELQLLGDGKERERLETYARGLPSTNSIHFLGFKTDRLIYLSNFNLFVMSSSDEGIPRCMMEAIAMGIPVAAYNIPGIDQLVIHEKTGLLANYDDKATLKAYWQKLLNDKDYAANLVENGRQHVIKKYSGRRMAKEYTTLYQSLLPTPASK